MQVIQAIADYARRLLRPRRTNIFHKVNKLEPVLQSSRYQFLELDTDTKKDEISYIVTSSQLAKLGTETHDEFEFKTNEKIVKSSSNVSIELQGSKLRSVLLAHYQNVEAS